MKYFDYMTNDGDRWDLLSFKFYKNACKYELIINANPEVEIVPILPSGIELKIPIIEMNNLLEGENLPPWKRG